MKYVGILVMAVAVIGGGFFAAELWRERLEILLLLRKMVYCLKGQILYSNATLPEALGEVGNRFLEGRSETCQEPAKLFLRVKERMETESGTTFFQIWREEIGKLPADFPMAQSDRQALLSLGENLGYAGRDMQERTLLLYLEQVDDSIVHLKKEIGGKTKLYRSLGMAAGLFLMVVLA